MATRPPAWAGKFYPAEPRALRAMILGFLKEAEETRRRAATPEAGESGPAASPTAPSAVIAPHAGYIYSGPVAGSAYLRLLPARGTIRRVVVIGTAHTVPFRGLAAAGPEAFETPLGAVRVDREAVEDLAGLPQVKVLDEAHAEEHSVEVQLPFLQEVLGEFRLVPLTAMEAGPEEVAEALERVWGGPDTLLVVSSDLSHYRDYAAARALDESTARAIESLRPEELKEGQACGLVPIRGLLRAARRRGLRAETVDLRNSGDTAGPKDRVVGYGAWVFRPEAGSRTVPDH